MAFAVWLAWAYISTCFSRLRRRLELLANLNSTKLAFFFPLDTL